jgi:type IV pilus assembly protein PilB
LIFGFGKKRDEEDDEDESEEVDYVQFQGAVNGKEANLAANGRLVQAGLVPSKEIVTDALLRRAEQVRIEPKGDRALVQLSVDGVPYAGARLSKQQGHAVTQMLKLLSGLDIQQRKKPQSGGIRAELEGAKYELRVVSTPIADGVERVVVRIRNLDKMPKSAEEVGFSPEMKEKVRELTGERKGIILVCGPAASGVSTTTFAVLRSVDAYQYTVYIIGDRQGWDLPNVNDFERSEQDEMDTVLDRAIRSEADVIYVDPLRDAENARLLLKFQPRTAFVCEFAALDAVQGILQLGKLVGDNKAVAEGVSASLSQRLIRTLCKDCKLAYRPNPKLLAKIGLPPETKTLYRAPPVGQPQEPVARGEEPSEPCATCGGTGYIGRTAMFELIQMTESVRKLVAAGVSPQEIKTQARKEKMTSLQQEGLRLVVEGKTSLEELQRVFQVKK